MLRHGTDKEFVNTISEFFLNLTKGNVQLKEEVKHETKQNRSLVRVLIYKSLPQPYHKQRKRLFTYLAEDENLQIDDKKMEALIYDKSFNLIDLESDMIANRKYLKYL